LPLPIFLAPSGLNGVVTFTMQQYVFAAFKLMQLRPIALPG
jgi:hypothetical protein